MKNILYTAICACSILCGAQAQTPGSEVPNLKKLYELTDSCDVNVRARFSPLIGISASISSGASRVGATYIQSIVKAGGTPIIIPAVTDGKVLRNIVSNLDGLVLIGGADVNPLWYEEEPREKLEEVDPVRDLYELKLIKMATDQNIPVLGICRGLQLLNVAFGGTLYQDIPSQRGDHSVKHRQDLPSSYGSHRVFVDANSQLASILGKDTLAVNSLHHQAIKELAPIFKATAYAPDSIIEAIDAYPNRSIMGVQWHPEALTYGGDTTMLRIFRHLIGKAETLQEAVQKVTGLIEGIRKQAELNKDLCGIAITNQDFIRLKNEGKKAFFIGIENGYGIGKDLANIAKFKAIGVNYITLCHSYDNDICDSSTHTKKEWDGLSPFGEEVVKEMNRQGIMVDMSHASEKSFWDVIKLSKAPIICSHSSSMAMCKHDRNLTDEQLKALAQNGGVAQVCLLDRYINEDYKNASLTDAIEHIDHMVKVAGIDHVGIGSDFDGGGGIIGCESDNDFIQITVKLIEKGYTEEDIAKIWGGNLMRVLDEVQATASVKTL